jgi:phosphatidylglycerol:prolipoprotein diacylglycerol transferase
MFCTEMNLPSPASRADNCYPRYFRIAGRWVNSFTVFLCVGIYLGILVSAALAQSAGIPPLRVGLGSRSSA